MEISRRNPERRREFVDLERERGWTEAAMIAAYDCQCRALAAKPWERAALRGEPCDKGKAGHLLRRMLARGISRYHPVPLAAIAAASQDRVSMPAAQPIRCTTTQRKYLRAIADAAGASPGASG